MVKMGRMSFSQVISYGLLVLVPLVVADDYHNFEVLGYNSTRTQFMCNYTDLSKSVYYDIYQNDRQCIHAADGSCAHTSDKFCICADKVEENQVIFTVRTPRCGEKLIITCKAINGIRSEKVIDITPKVSQPKLTVNEGNEVYIHVPIPVACYTQSMCIGEELTVKDHHDYYRSESTVVHHIVEGNARRSANLTTSLVFINPGKYNVTCITSINKRTATVTVHAVDQSTNSSPKSDVTDVPTPPCGKVEEGIKSIVCVSTVIISVLGGTALVLMTVFFYHKRYTVGDEKENSSKAEGSTLTIDTSAPPISEA